MRYWRYIVYTLAFIVFVSLPFYTGVYFLNVVGIIFIYLSLALSWDIFLRSGQISLGMAGFCGVGAYTAGLTFLHAGIHPLFSIFLSGLMGGIIAFLIGISVLHLREMYFAIVTLALAEIIRVVIRNVPDLSGGPEGRTLPAVIFDGDPTMTYWLVLILALGTMVISIICQKSRIHFALTSIRNDEIVAKSSGINVFKYLVLIFIVISAIQGMAGGIYAHIYGFISPEASFSFDFALLPIAMTLLGGVYTTWGPVIGAVLLGSIAEFLKLRIPYGHLLIYGLIIVIAVLFFPRGIVGTFRKRIK